MGTFKRKDGTVVTIPEKKKAPAAAAAPAAPAPAPAPAAPAAKAPAAKAEGYGIGWVAVALLGGGVLARLFLGRLAKGGSSGTPA